MARNKVKTGKLTGNAVLVQSGLSNAATNSVLAGFIHQCKKQSSIKKVYGALGGFAGLAEEKLINLSKERSEIISSLRLIASPALGTDNTVPGREDVNRILSVMADNDIRYCFLSGGRDAMKSAHFLCETSAAQGYEMRLMAVPASADNDVGGTDYVPGYPGAAQAAAVMIMELGRDFEAMNPKQGVMIYETGSFSTGWLVAAGVLGKKRDIDAPHVLVLPETRFDSRHFITSVKAVLDRLGRCIVCTAGDVDGPRCAENLKRLIRDEIKIKVELFHGGGFERLSMCHILRSDSKQAYSCARKAVKLSTDDGLTDHFTALKRKRNRPGFSIETIELSEAVKSHPIPDEMLCNDGYFVNNKYFKYATDLIGKLPSHARLRAYPLSPPGKKHE